MRDINEIMREIEQQPGTEPLLRADARQRFAILRRQHRALRAATPQIQFEPAAPPIEDDVDG